MSKNITFEQAVTAAAKAVGMRGMDYTYFKVWEGETNSCPSSCFYVHRDALGVESPGCIVGEIFYSLGAATLEELKSVESVGSTLAASKLAITMDDRTTGFLAALQSRQDDGIEWGRAFVNAIRNTAPSTF